MFTSSRIVAQLLALVALVCGWIDPTGALTSAGQAAVTAGAAAVVAGVHLATAIENAAHHKALATAPKAKRTT